MPADLTSANAWLQRLRERTPARLLPGRSGPSYRTATQLELRRDHAAARDAVLAEVDLERDLGGTLLRETGLFEVSTRAGDKSAYLMRPDLGRSLSEAAALQLRERCSLRPELQIAVGDGLSAAAVRAQVPLLLPRLLTEAAAGGWRIGQPFFIRHCRVGVLNDLGDVLQPEVVVLLIGERPGLATADSLSAYLAYRPHAGHTDAHRNLISNIHARGVPLEEAVRRILALAGAMRRAQTSGVAIKEDFSLLKAVPTAVHLPPASS